MTSRPDYDYSLPVTSGLLHNRAFVLQLRCEADIAANRVAGRVEHVASGRATRFASLDELLEFLDRVLKDVPQPTD